MFLGSIRQFRFTQSLKTVTQKTADPVLQLMLKETVFTNIVKDCLFGNCNFEILPSPKSYFCALQLPVIFKPVQKASLYFLTTVPDDISDQSHFKQHFQPKLIKRCKTHFFFKLCIRYHFIF